MFLDGIYLTRGGDFINVSRETIYVTIVGFLNTETKKHPWLLGKKMIGGGPRH